MATKRRRLPLWIAKLLKSPPLGVSSFSYDPQTGAFAVSYVPPLPIAIQPQDEAESEGTEAEKPPEDFRFALERFNAPARRRAQ